MSAHKSRLAIAVVAAIVMSTAGCSSSDSSGPAKSTGGGASPSGAVPANVAAARAAVATAKKPPTKIAVTEPLKSKPAPGGSIIYIQCDASTCKPPGEGLRKATSAVGWGYRNLTYQLADPATLVAAMKQALTYKPTAVVIPSTPIQVWQTEIKDYQAAGVKIVPIFQEVTPTATVIGNIAGDQGKTNGSILSNWLISDSNGKANTLVVSVDAIPSEVATADAFKSDLKANCPGCKNSDLKLTLAQFSNGGGTPAVVSALQRDTSIRYVMNGYGPQLPGLAGALSAAGLSKRVQVIGSAASSTEFAGVKAGQYSAYVGTSFTYAGLLAADVVFRDQQHVAYEPTDGGLLLQLYTKDEQFSLDEASNYNLPTDALDQFKVLWKAA